MRSGQERLDSVDSGLKGVRECLHRFCMHMERHALVQFIWTSLTLFQPCKLKKM